MTPKEFKKIVGLNPSQFAKQWKRETSKVYREIQRGRCSLTKTVGNRQKHPLYRSWRNMMDRCYYSGFIGYHNYGGKGIRVCGRWFYSFDNFVEDMGEKPKGYTLDRIDSNGDYSPENCRWANIYTQNQNRNHRRGKYVNITVKKGRLKKYCVKIMKNNKLVEVGSYNNLVSAFIGKMKYLKENPHDIA